LRYKSILPLEHPQQALGFNESATPLMETQWEGPLGAPETGLLDGLGFVQG